EDERGRRVHGASIGHGYSASVLMRRLGVRALVGAVLIAGCLAAPAQARIPAGWLGVNLNDFALSAKVDLGGEAGVMSRAGIQSVRIPVFWDRTEPARG